MMCWEDERYVRLYTRDTIDWLALTFEGQGLLSLILRKADRAGLIKLGRHGARGVAAAVGHPHRWETLAPALDELLTDGVVIIRGDTLVVRNYVAAQETTQSDAARKRTQRERARDLAMSEGLPLGTSQMMVDELARMDRVSRNVTGGVTCVTESRTLSRPVVTDGHTVTDAVPSVTPEVTPCRAVPCRSEPTVPSEPETTLSTDSPPTAPVVEQLRLEAQSVEELASGPTPPQQVFEHWRGVMGKTAGAKLKGGRLRAVKARLDDGYSVEDLCQAVDGCAVTPHNMGQNDRGERYDDLELICRDVAHVERFMANARAPPRPRGPDPHKAPVRAEDIPKSAFSKTGAVSDF